MPLEFIQETTGNAFIRYMVRDNQWLRSTATGDVEEFDISEAAVVVDIENIKLGWLKLEGGRDWQVWPNRQPPSPTPPTTEHRQGFSVKFYSTKLFNDERVRELCSSTAGVREFINNLFDEAEKAKEFGSGKVPAVKITDGKKVKWGKNDSRIPQFEIVKWVNRPDELIGEDQEQKTENASSISPASQSGDAKDDVDFNENDKTKQSELEI